jgi:hypothetical protein
MPKSAAEAERYSVDNCALEAKFMREGGGGGGKAKTAVVDKGGEDEMTSDNIDAQTNDS